MRKLIVIVLLIAGTAAAGAWYWYSGTQRPVTYRTAKVERGDMLASVSATGTIQAEEVIDVGAQVAGQIIKFGDDPRDKNLSTNRRPMNFGSPVNKGDVLALIDPRLYKTLVDRSQAQYDSAQASVDQSVAQVASAKANLKRAEADLGQMQAKVYQSDRDMVRARRLKSTAAVADLDFDIAESTYRTAKATLAVGEATIEQTKAALKDSEANVRKARAMQADAKAALDNAKINFDYCTIVSPVKGIIIDRRVNIGQTVVSSLNAPSLFLLATDLRRLQVWASVNEADFGNIRSGQPVTFTVDTYPGRVFKGVVAADNPRLNASMTQNVVTYTVVVNTDNLDGKLVPYLTANMQFEVSKHSQVLKVPNAALRFKPNPNLVVPDERDAYVQKQRKKAATDQPQVRADRESHNKGTLWLEEGGLLRPVKVTIGPSDGLMTEIVKGDINEGDPVVLGESKANAGGGTSNPFAPKMFGGKKQ